MSGAVLQVNLPLAKQPTPQLNRLIFRSAKSTAKARAQTAGAALRQTPRVLSPVAEGQQNIPPQIIQTPPATEKNGVKLRAKQD